METKRYTSENILYAFDQNSDHPQNSDSLPHLERGMRMT